jgi:hypothetical protein
MRLDEITGGPDVRCGSEEAPFREARRLPRLYAIRKPRDHVVTAPGDLVQLDTKDVRPVPGKVFKHLSLVDITSRYATAEVGWGASRAQSAERSHLRMLEF